MPKRGLEKKRVNKDCCGLGELISRQLAKVRKRIWLFKTFVFDSKREPFVEYDFEIFDFWLIVFKRKNTSKKPRNYNSANKRHGSRPSFINSKNNITVVCIEKKSHFRFAPSVRRGRQREVPDPPRRARFVYRCFTFTGT